ncbi:MAG: hypothetical protein ABI772_04685 [Bacteroidota bacterium]
MSTSVLYPLPHGYSIRLSEVMSDAWKKHTRSAPVFFTPDYLHALENAQMEGFCYIYGEIYKNDVHAGLIYFQLIDLAFVKIGSVIHSEPYGKFMKLVSDKITSSLLGKKKGKKHFLLVNGNMCVSGNYGLFISDDHKNALPQIYKNIYESAASFIESEGELSVSIIKDFHFSDDVLNKTLISQGFIRFVMDPVMVLKMDASWLSFNDYLQSLSSKYRLRTLTVMEKISGYELRTLEVDDIEKHRERLEFLYQSVIGKSPVRIVQPDMKYIIELKKSMKDTFIVKAWFDNDQPAAFFTVFNFNNVSEAHHIGIDYQLNRTHSLYQNMLYAHIDMAIQNKSKYLDYGRTAMEMKSTVGATPENYAAYIRMNSRVLNHLIKPFLPSEPPSGWVQRYPFRKPGEN